jgi:hypothetical protein
MTQRWEHDRRTKGGSVMNDAEEVARLRARIAELEAAQMSASGNRESVDRGSRWRALGASLLIVIACVLAPLSVVSVWASTVVSDTEQYVETVAPVADNPDVQAALADQVTAAIMDNLDVEGLTTQALDALAQLEQMPPRIAAALPALATPLTQGIESFVRTQTGNLMASDQFAAVWAQANEVAHNQVVNLLEGNEGGAISAQDDAITLNLAPIIAEVKARLVDQGFALAGKIPEIDKSFTLVQSGGITKAQTAYSFLNTLGVWLPIIAVALFAAGVFLAHDRRRALMRGALGVTAAMVLLGVGLLIVRTLYVETTPAGILTAESAGNVFDTLIRFLRTGLRAVAVLGLLVALAAFLTGPSSAAVSTRSGLARGIGSARGSAEARGWNTGPVGVWVFAHKKVLRVAVFVAAGFTLMFWTRPSAAVVITVALLVVVALVVIEFLSSPTTQAVSPTAPDG